MASDETDLTQTRINDEISCLFSFFRVWSVFHPWLNSSTPPAIFVEDGFSGKGGVCGWFFGRRSFAAAGLGFRAFQRWQLHDGRPAGNTLAVHGTGSRRLLSVANVQ